MIHNIYFGLCLNVAAQFKSEWDVWCKLLNKIGISKEIVIYRVKMLLLKLYSIQDLYVK